MKTLIAFSILVFALSAQAAEVTGRAALTLWPMDRGGILTLDIRQEGNKILGTTFYGRSGLVNLEVREGRYLGFAGGDAATDLTCKSGMCDGIIAGNSAHFKTSTRQTRHGAVVETKGQVNFHFVTIDRSTKQVEISVNSNTLVLRRVRSGVFEGDAYLFTDFGGIARYTARLETSGSLQGLADNDALSTIFLATPLNRR